MSQEPIDDIFKSGFAGSAFANKDANWSKLEKQLIADKRKRSLGWWMLFACIASAAIGLLVYQQPVNHSYQSAHNTSNAFRHASTAPGVDARQMNAATPSPGAENEVAIKQATTTNHSNSIIPATEAMKANVPAVSAPLIKASTAFGMVTNNSTIASPNSVAAEKASYAGKQIAIPYLSRNNKKHQAASGATKHHTGISITGALPEEIDDAALVGNPERMAGVFDLVQVDRKPHVRLQRTSLPATLLATNADKKKPAQAGQQKFTIELVAGSDIFHLNKQVGYYGGFRLIRHLDNGSAISFGVNYTYNSMSEKYRLADKPFQQQETDAQLNSMRMLRFPVMFQRKLAHSRFSLMAGLTPSYILNASVYNVPPSSPSGNPADYREFTLKDMNRLNILFGAGLHYNATKSLGFELSGSYGFTELVKDSYINQSNVNGNFRNIQAGLVFKLN